MTPVVEAIVKAAKKEIVDDMIDSVVPPVDNFAALHDYTDANLYGAEKLPKNLSLDDQIDIMNEAQGELDAWLAATGYVFRSTCYACEAVWGACKCAEHVEGFLWNNALITSPNVSECGRFFVEPALYYGDAFTNWAAAGMKVG